ncbi:MAG: hypothetical protein ACMUIU_02160 [bacterium]
MKESLSIVLIVCFFLSMCLFVGPGSARAERPFRGIFIDTMFGVATGTVIGAAVTLAEGDAHGDDWGKNLGIGATIGAFVGLGFGLATETRALVYLDEKGSDIRLPMPRLCKRHGSKSSSMVFFNLLDWRY